MAPLSTNERIAVLETEVAQLKKVVEGVDAKLDSLLEVKNKGLGAFWFASGLVGLALSGAFAWMKGLFF